MNENNEINKNDDEMNDVDGLECRVCRCGPEDERPLYQPCLCSGSIALVHQDCLETWLQHSNKDKCELCSTKYVFTPEYAADAPEWMPFLIKIILAGVMWIIFVPIFTSRMYRFHLHDDSIGKIINRSSLQLIKCDIISGLVVIGVVLLTTIILMSYGEFVGLFWAGDGLRNPVNQQRNPAPVQRQYQQREVLPLPVIPRPVVRPHLNLQPIREDDQIEIGQIDSDSTMPLMELSSRLTIESDASVDGNETYVHTPKVREMRRTSSGFNNWPKSSLDSCDFRQAGAAFNESMVISPQVYMHGRNSISSSNSIKAEIAGVVDLPDDESQYFKEMTSGLSNSNSGNSFENINSDTKIENELSVDYISDSFSSDDSSEDSNSSYDIDDDYSELSEEDWDDDEMNLPDNNNNNNNNNGGDLRFALDELFGLRGPLPMTIFKHVLWFICFITVFLYAFVYFPVSMGSIIYEFLMKHLPYLEYTIYLIPSNLFQIIVKSYDLSIQLDSLLLINHIGLIMMGYLSILFIITLWYHIMLFIRDKLISSLDVYVKFLDNMVLSGKIALLLSIRIFVVPISLGFVILYSLNTLFQKSADEIIMNLAKNLVGSLTLSWTVGITYMLIITLSVLQLREILHPDILSSHIRPQESHVELLQSLVSEKSLVHFRRLVVSMTVYLILLFFILVIPIFLTKQLLLLFNITKLNILNWYYIPELQLPLEVAIGHFTTLSILEQKKNYIGRVLYLWLIYICRRLKMTRFILPCPMKRDTSINNRSNNNLVNNDSNGGSSNEPPVLVDGNGVPYVDRPLRRPPPGWDARFHENRVYDNRITTRWAWGNEEPSALELNVAPRVIPKNYVYKTLMLLLSSWSLLSLLVVSVIIIPITIGRFLFNRLIPFKNLSHDPINFILGVIVCYAVSLVLKNIMKYDWAELYSILKKIPKRTITRVAYLIMMWNLNHIGLKIFFKLIVDPTVKLSVILSPVSLFKLLFEKKIFLDSVGLLLIDGGGEYLFQKLGIPDIYNLIPWSNQIKQSFQRFILAMSNQQFDEESLCIQSFLDLLVLPIFNIIVKRMLLLVCSGWVISFFLYQTLIVNGYQVNYKEFYKFSNRTTTSVILTYWVIIILLGPLYKLHDQLSKAIKDETYLIGRRLQNVRI